MTVIFKRERAHDVFEEMIPLLEAHFHEIAHFKDIPFNPDRELYEAMEEQGCLRVFTARNDGVLIGYAVYVVRHNGHYKSSLQAVQDVLFLLPEYRKARLGAELISVCDNVLRAEGVQVVYQHVKLAHNFGPLLEKLGYEVIEHIYGKRLD